jgi:hypothetical protein
MSNEQDSSTVKDLELSAPMTRDQMLNIVGMDIDDHPVQNMSLSAKRRLRASILKLRTGVQSVVPMTCPGAYRCPFQKKCPLVDNTITDANGDVDYRRQNTQDFPIGCECVVERTLLNIKRREYLEEYDVEPDSPTDIGFANKLAELDLLEMRVSIILSSGDLEGEGQDLLKQSVVGVDDRGNAVKNLQIHPAWPLKQQIQQQREKILQHMVGTRREQWKRDAALKQTNTEGLGSQLVQLKNQLEQQRRDPIGDDEIVDAEFTEEQKETSSGDEEE